MHNNLVVSNLEVAALHAAPAVLVIGAGPLGEGVVAQPRHQGDVVVVEVGAVVVVPVRQGALSRLVMATIIIILVLLVVVVVMVMVVLWRMIVRNVLQCRLRL